MISVSVTVPFRRYPEEGTEIYVYIRLREMTLSYITASFHGNEGICCKTSTVYRNTPLLTHRIRYFLVDDTLDP